ncbi:MAG TPA: DUF4097 family beta strand repeat-containing protein [Gemmatimonadota bacterium]|nr:DUF4097 family beta strand repeat-containing protein [Gemmatimonadota bacterium]
MKRPTFPTAALAGAAFLVSLSACDAAQGAIRDTVRATASAASTATREVTRAAGRAAGSEKSSTFDWKGQIDAGKALEIRGINGGIAAHAVSGREATVHATLTGRDSDPTSVKVEVVRHDGNVTLCAVYPGEHGRENTCEPGGGHQKVHDNDVRVEFEVGVPQGVAFTPVTVNGEVEADGLSGPVRARTVNGSISLETTSWADAHTVNGSIHARMGSTKAPDGLDFKTVNGSISLVLPPDAALDVEAKTVSGGISTDFPLTVSGKFVGHRLSGTIGGGGTSLTLQSVNGSLDLKKG